MERSSLSPVERETQREAMLPTPQARPRADELSEVCQAIGEDCRVDAERYREEVRTAAGGE